MPSTRDGPKGRGTRLSLCRLSRSVDLVCRICLHAASSGLSHSLGTCTGELIESPDKLGCMLGIQPCHDSHRNHTVALDFLKLPVPESRKGV